MSYFNSITQNVIADPNNSYDGTLASGATWTGTASSTLGVVGLQFSMICDQNCTVYVEQSPDGTNWDIRDTYEYITDIYGNGWTTQALNSYVRVLVQNDGTMSASTFRCQMALCPMVEALPRSLTDDGRLKTETHIKCDANDRQVFVSRQRELTTSPVFRLVGSSIHGTDYDTSFWLSGGINGGTVVIDGEVKMNTSTNVAGASTWSSVAKARYVTGSDNLFRGQARLITPPVAGNYRRFGAYTSTDGFFYQVSGTTFGIGHRRKGTETIIENGSFNGRYGPSLLLDLSTKEFEIEYGVAGAKWYVAKKLLHEIDVTTDPLSDVFNLPVYVENVNTGSAVDNEQHIYNLSIFRIGELQTYNRSKYISTNTTTICKLGAGRLHRVIVTDNAGRITLYDSKTATGTIIAVIDASRVFGSIEFSTSFSNGLTIVTAGGSKVSVIYE